MGTEIMNDSSNMGSVTDKPHKMAAKQANWPFVINLGNSIIGVSVLAMPFCFKQCGVLLGTLLLCSSAFLTKMSCSLLIRGAHTSRKRSYEYLALHTFGPAGKLCVEISIIGLLVGTCVAFFVVIGDLGPAIISRILGLENTSKLRAFLMVFLATFVAFPLGLLKNIESLSNISAMSIGFYTVFVAEVFVTSFPNLWSGVWVAEVVYWNPAGVFKCLPIFSLAFACQTQLFVMYDALAEPSLKRISNITKNAIGMCTSVYLLVGYFGYVAFCREDISGDILLNFRPTLFSEAVKLGFVLSVAVSFPLVIFPLRAALYTLLFHKHESESHEVESAFKEHEKQEVMGPIYIPDTHLKVLTFCIILTTLIVGILLPNIEFVLALTGATMGSMICFIFPAVMYISIMSNSNSHGKSTAQVVLFLGVTILLASTYVTLNAQDQDKLTYEEKVNPPQQADVPPDVMDRSRKDQGVKDEQEKQGDDVIKDPEKEVDKKEEGEDEGEKRQEPPNPQAPVDNEEAKIQQAELEEVERKVAEDLLKFQEQDKLKADKKAAKEKEKQEEKTEDKQKEEQDNKGEAKEILNELKEQQKVQVQLIEEQKQIIEELKQHQKEAHQAEEQAPVVQQQGQQVQGGQQVPGVVQGGQQVQGSQQVQGGVKLQADQKVQGSQQVQGQQVQPDHQVQGGQPLQQQLGNIQGAQMQQVPDRNQQPIANQQPLANQQPVGNQQPLPNQQPVASQQILPGDSKQNILNLNQQDMQINNQELGNQQMNKQPVDHPQIVNQPVLQQNQQNPQLVLRNDQQPLNEAVGNQQALPVGQNVQQNMPNANQQLPQGNNQQIVQNPNPQNIPNPNQQNIPLGNQQQMQGVNQQPLGGSQGQQPLVGNQQMAQGAQKPVLPELQEYLDDNNNVRGLNQKEGQKLVQAGVGQEQKPEEF